MPGIAGLITRNPPVECELLLHRMIASMCHESFYVSGSGLFPDLGIYAGWLAHPCSFAARQSGYDKASDVALIFSGECFEDDHGLDAAGRSWIIQKYEKLGERCLDALNGLFSGLLIDCRRRRAFLFNDRYGVERIYCHEAKDGIYFASEAKALLAARPELRAFDDNGVVQYLAFGCTTGEQTLFRGVSLLPGGSKWTLTNGKVQSRARYFKPNAWEMQDLLTENQFQTEFAELFQRSLARYTEHSETVGISLTGGIDTRMVMACLPTTRTRHPCYTFVGENGLTTDARLAAKIAAMADLEHHALRIKPDFLQHFETELDRTIYVTDGCAGATSSHEIYFNRQAREISPVRLTGNFGSEVLRSVSTFKPFGLHRGLIDNKYAQSIAAEARNSFEEGAHPVTFAAFREIPWNLFGLLAAGRSQVTFRTPYLDNDLVALAYRAPVALRISPLPALRLIEQANPGLARIPTDRGERLGGSGFQGAFRRAFGAVTFKLDYFHNDGLPPFLNTFNPLLELLAPLGIFGLHKFLPYRRWFRKEVASTVMERASSRRVREAPWWSKGSPELFARAHIAGRGNYVRELSAVLSLEAIERLLLQIESPVWVPVPLSNVNSTRNHSTAPRSSTLP